MPYKEKEIERKYWNISQASDKLGVPSSTIRYWESQFGKIHCKRSPHKGPSTTRVFNKKGMEMLEKIKTLLYIERYTIEGARLQLINGK